MRASLVQIGNSRGVRIPKAFVKQAGLGDEVDIQVRGSTVVIRAVKRVRAGWEESFREMAARGDDQLLDMPKSKWDDSEWQW